MKNKIVKFTLGFMVGFSVGIGILMSIQSCSKDEEREVTQISELKLDKELSRDCNRSLVACEEEIDNFYNEYDVVAIRLSYEERYKVEKEIEEYNGCEYLDIPQLSDEDIYYLRKIATCEAGNQDIQTMSLIMLTVLNRVKDDRFPNTIYEVITECNNGKYQFSVVRPGGTWWYMEPNEESEEAFNMMWNALYDYSDGCLFFESMTGGPGSGWFGTLEYLYQSGDVRFYR